MLNKFLKDSFKRISKYTLLNVQQGINKFLVKFFHKLGHDIAVNPAKFVLIPLLISLLLISGLYNVTDDADFNTLNLPKWGQWNEEKEDIDKSFKVKPNFNFDPVRTTTLGQYVNVIIKTKESGNILSEDNWDVIERLDDSIGQVTVEHNGNLYNYSSLCNKWKGRCFSPLLPIRPVELSHLGKLVESISNEVKSLAVQQAQFIDLALTLMLGRTNVSREGVVESAEALSLFYWLRSDDPYDKMRARMWEKQVLDLLNQLNSTAIETSAYAARTPEDEMNVANEKMKPLIAISGILMITFAAASASMHDSVRSKVILSILGIASVVLATSSAFGLLSFLKVPFIGMNYVAVFLMLGIGIDDMFVFLSAWRATSILDPVEKRMGSTYGHACVSVTITSLTNTVSFAIGSLTGIKTIEIFCIYSCLSSLFTYVFFLTFFGGCLAIFGYVERNQRHSLCFVKVKSKSESKQESFWYRLLMSGGVDKCDPDNPLDNKPHYGMVFVRDTVGVLLSNSISKGIICASFIIYIGIVAYGISQLELESTPNRVSFQKLTSDYFQNYDFYFRNKPSFVQVSIGEELEYSNPITKFKLLRLQRQFESLPFVLSNFTTSWFADWYSVVDQNLNIRRSITDEKSFIYQLREYKDTTISPLTNITCKKAIEQLQNFKWTQVEKNVQNLDVFVQILEDFPCSGKELASLVLNKAFADQTQLTYFINLILWVNHNAHKADDFYQLDIKFNEKLDRIQASRFILVLDNSSGDDVQSKLREVAKRSDIPGVKVFNFRAVITDQIDLVKKTTITSTLSTTFIVLFISLLLIPNPCCSIWVASSIVSIELGVIGLMAIWSVRLDAVSMINLIMCVGFSVDFSAHIAYAYLSSSGFSPKERVRDAVYNVGFPIILGGLSTIIGIAPIYFSDSVVFVTFFKIVFLVITLGLLHGLFYLPTFMSLFDQRSGLFDQDKFKLYEVASMHSSKDDTHKIIPESSSDGSAISTRNHYSSDIFIIPSEVETDLALINNYINNKYLKVNESLHSKKVHSQNDINNFNAEIRDQYLKNETVKFFNKVVCEVSTKPEITEAVNQHAEFSAENTESDLPEEHIRTEISKDSDTRSLSSDCSGTTIGVHSLEDEDLLIPLDVLQLKTRADILLYKKLFVKI